MASLIPMGAFVQLAKPKLTPWNGAWLCEGQKIVCKGRTPLIAYQRWRFWAVEEAEMNLHKASFDEVLG